MHWVNTKAGTLHSLTGTTVARFVRSELKVTSLVVDTAGGKLYWTERTGDSSGTIKCVNLDGTNIELLAKLPTIPIGIAIGSGRNKLYWTSSDRAIQSANLNGENVKTVIQLEDEIVEKTSTSCAPIAKDAEVSLTIYAVNGHVVRRLALGHQPVGMYQTRSRAAYWDSRNAFGEPVASGVYFYTLTAGDFTATRKMLIRK